MTEREKMLVELLRMADGQVRSLEQKINFLESEARHLRDQLRSLEMQFYGGNTQ